MAYSEMTHPEIKKLVIDEYRNRYPQWSGLDVTEIVKNAFGGHLAAIRAKDESGNDNEELCFVYPEGSVRIFHTTEELVRFLEQKARASFFERVLFSRPAMSGLVFLILLIGLFVIGFTSCYNPQVLQLLIGLAGIAAGFLFGTSKTA